MTDFLDPVVLARIQFAFTISFHIIFPSFTIGLASWLAVVEWRYLKTGKDVYQDIYRMWVKIFAVTFGTHRMVCHGDWQATIHRV